MAYSDHERDLERSNFVVLDQKPGLPSMKDRARAINTALSELQKVERAYQGRDEVVVGVKHNDPILVLNVGDLHMGSVATDHEAIIRLRDSILADSNTLVVLTGDLVEGIKQAYLNTNTARTPIDFHMQVDFLNTEFIEPLAKSGRIAAMVSGYWGHEGWIEDATTVNPWIMQAAHWNIPILRNGGRVVIRFANGQENSTSVFHNPPGKGKVESIHGLREAALSTSESVRSEVYFSAHLHRMGVGEENFAGALKSVHYLACPTAKGSSEEIPFDRFGGKLAAPLADPLSEGTVGVIMRPHVRGKEEWCYGVPTARHAEVARRAFRKKNEAEKTGKTAELLELIEKKVGGIKVKFEEKRSFEVKKKFDETPEELRPTRNEPKRSKTTGEDYAPQYDKLAHTLVSRIAVAYHPFAHVRLGCSYDGEADLRRYIRDFIADNPYAVSVFLRAIIDKEAAGSLDRRLFLDKYIDLVRQAKALAVMLDGDGLRNGGFKKPLLAGYEEDENGKKVPVYEEAIAPGTYISKMTGVPLIHDLSTHFLSIGPSQRFDQNTIYSGALADKLFNSGSFSKHTFGQQQIYNRYIHEKPGFVAGGHMPNSGTMIFYDGSNQETHYPILVAPGWWAAYIDTAGKGNVRPGAVPGQALIFMPGKHASDYLVFSTANASITKDLHEGLIIDGGLEILGLTEKVFGKKR